MAAAGPNAYHAGPPGAVQVQSDGQRHPAQALLPSGGPRPFPARSPTRPGGGVRGGAAHHARSAPGPTTNPHPDRVWRPRAHRASAPPSSTGARVRRRCRRAPLTHVVGHRPLAAACRSRHAARSGHARLSLGLADPGRPLRPSQRRNGTAVSVLCEPDPSGRIDCQLTVR